MKDSIKKLLILIITLLIVVLNLTLYKLPKNIETFPVEDGSLIQDRINTKPLLHYSVFNVRRTDGYKEPLIISGSYNMIKDIRYPKFPSFINTYYSLKHFNSTSNNGEVIISTNPSTLANDIQINISTNYNKILFFGIETFFNYNKQSIINPNTILLENDNCKIKIMSTGEFQKDVQIGNNILWFSGEKSISFLNQITCK